MNITITNKFHGRSYTMRAPRLPHTLSPHQQRKVRELCGVRNCRCWQHSIVAESGEKLALDGYTPEGRWILGVA